MSSAVSGQHRVVAGDRERQTLADVEQLLDRLGTGRRKARLRLVASTGEGVELPESVVHLVHELVRHLARGDSVALVSRHKELTTQQAADLLNVSRPYLVRLLERGDIPFTKTGRHRRVRFSDLIAYQEQRDAQRRRALARLTQLSQEAGLYAPARSSAE
jgi:excisionase family DNA binding protein